MHQHELDKKEKLVKYADVSPVCRSNKYAHGQLNVNAGNYEYASYGIWNYANVPLKIILVKTDWIKYSIHSIQPQW